MKKKNIISKLFRLFASLIENLSDEEIDNLLSDKGILVYKSVSNHKAEQKAPSSLDKEEILKKLNECKDREEARSVLSNIPNKEILTAIAKSLKVHVVKYDRREDIENKLIEFVIGAKLRTEAIHSLNMKGGTGNG